MKPPSLESRTTLTVSEVAHYLDCTKRHVRNLIEDGRLEAINISRHENNRPSRPSYRIPVPAYTEFVSRRSGR